MKVTREKIESSIQRFSKANLDEVKSIKSPKRTKSKFVFSIRKLPEVLEDMLQDYNLLYVDNVAIHPHTTIYFDTREHTMYHEHQNGKVNRYKIRHKNYDVSKIGFLELKYKNNKGQKWKQKIHFDISNQDISDADFFLRNNSPFSSKELFPQLVITYTRLTFMNKKKNEKITCDYQLNITPYGQPDHTINLEHLCVIEIKRSRCLKRSVMKRVLLKHRIFPNGMSKYCIGLAIINKELKRNRFKEKLRMLDKFKYSLSR